MKLLQELLGLPKEEVKANLSAIADKISENETYTKKLTPEEVTAHRARVTDSVIAIDRINDEIKNFKDSKKGALTELGNELKASKYAVKTGYDEVKGNLYYIADQDARIMYIVDEAANIVNQRPLLPEERQTTLMSASRNLAANEY